MVGVHGENPHMKPVMLHLLGGRLQNLCLSIAYDNPQQRTMDRSWGVREQARIWFSVKADDTWHTLGDESCTQHRGAGEKEADCTRNESWDLQESHVPRSQPKLQSAQASLHEPCHFSNLVLVSHCGHNPMILVIGSQHSHSVLARGKVGLFKLQVGIRDLKVSQCCYQPNPSPCPSNHSALGISLSKDDSSSDQLVK